MVARPRLSHHLASLQPCLTFTPADSPPCCIADLCHSGETAALFFGFWVENAPHTPQSAPQHQAKVNEAAKTANLKSPVIAILPRGGTDGQLTVLPPGHALGCNHQPHPSRSQTLSLNWGFASLPGRVDVSDSCLNRSPGLSYLPTFATQATG